ncbi:LacI family DNA-binding transcriptional regulator [Sphingomonas sp. PAMC 26605]|uniref:LacI family DNA-binding transcriptional regulator n=1 Tax=Sphingomonas sp. PAMC 26605 TaxID=1112214 RepID=UPI00055CEBF5|nr:LacI family DNA-binding transcriptional regulator [Sphingomonas sp. PAMC 26605]
MSVLTIKDVAALAGVSPKTVSRVINGEPHVRPDKRERVLRVVGELDYRPNAFARSLSSSRSYLLALLIDDPASGYAADVQLGALMRCREKNYHLIVERVERVAVDWQNELSRSLRGLNLDGVILTPPLCDDTALAKLLEKAAIPFVRIAPSGAESASGYVRMDDASAASEMTRHLVALGHRRIGFIKGDPAHGATATRLQGFTSEMERSNLTTDPVLIREGDFSSRSGFVEADALLALPDPPTAIFASNDDMALGTLMAATRRGLAVPQTLAIAGFDDAPSSRVTWPQLTTIHQPKAAMAAEAVDILTNPEYRDHCADPNYRRAIEYRLVVRGSTDAGAGATPGAI